MNISNAAQNKIWFLEPHAGERRVYSGCTHSDGLVSRGAVRSSPDTPAAPGGQGSEGSLMAEYKQKGFLSVISLVYM